jgi:N-acyl-D-aspartate/D-glutamate deacylase
MLREGAWADVVVYDMAGLGIEPEWIGEITHDFPGGEWRRVQRAKGYRAIIVNGAATFEEGKATGATSGKLLRHGHA